MRKLSLDFSKESKRKNRSVGVLLLITGLAVAVWIASMHNELKIEQQQIQSALDQRQDKVRHQVGASQDENAAEHYQRAAAVIDQLSFPWDRLFQAIERSTGEGIALLSIQPNLETKTVVLDAESKNWEGMLGYIRRLEGDGFFSDVHLVNHQTQVSDPQKPVRFRLDCRWQSLLTLSVATPSTSGQP